MAALQFAMPLLQYLVAPLIAGIVSAFLTQYFGAHFTLSRFRKEQWWQAKRDAYEAVTRILSDILFRTTREIAKAESHDVVVLPSPPERKKELAWTLQEIASGGTFIVSERTTKAVEKVLNVLAETGDPDFYNALCREYDAVKDALAIVRAEAHRELGVTA